MRDSFWPTKACNLFLGTTDGLHSLQPQARDKAEESGNFRSEPEQGCHLEGAPQAPNSCPAWDLVVFAGPLCHCHTQDTSKLVREDRQSQQQEVSVFPSIKLGWTRCPQEFLPALNL